MLPIWLRGVRLLSLQAGLSGWLGSRGIACTISGGRPKRTFSGITSTSSTDRHNPSGLEILDNVLDQHFRRRSARRHGYGIDPVQPLRLDGVGACRSGRNSCPDSFETSTSRFELELLRRADHKHQVCPVRHILDRDLAIFGGVADVLRVRPDDVGELLLQCASIMSPRLVERQRRLGQVGDACPGRARSASSTSSRVETTCVTSGASPCVPSIFFVVAMADQHKRIALLGELDRLNMHLGHQRAGRVDNLQAGGRGRAACTAGETPCAE